MAGTTTLAKDSQEEAARTGAGEAAAPPAGEAAPEPQPAPAGAAGEASVSGSDYRLLNPPDYDGIVGGVPPSPYASVFLLGGLLCLVAGAIGTGMGQDMTQWWILGAMLVAVAVFLAAFVSRA
ncbi:MAG TPA: hypothetical protein VHN78_10225 [Chloroflexota bacterium]|nr:hypothetical protein [Chloroflexota bacterium]